MSEYDRHKEAQGLYIQTVDLYRTPCGPEHNETLVALDMLAFNYRHQRKYEEAEKIFKEVLEVQKRIFGPEYVNTLIVMLHLASLYFEMERYDEAVSQDTAVSEM
jgi:eukaryotic-like serine/threonine-protein kinase